MLLKICGRRILSNCIFVSTYPATLNYTKVLSLKNIDQPKYIVLVTFNTHTNTYRRTFKAWLSRDFPLLFVTKIYEFDAIRIYIFICAHLDISKPKSLHEFCIITSGQQFPFRCITLWNDGLLFLLNTIKNTLVISSILLMGFSHPHFDENIRNSRLFHLCSIVFHLIFALYCLPSDSDSLASMSMFWLVWYGTLLVSRLLYLPLKIISTFNFLALRAFPCQFCAPLSSNSCIKNGTIRSNIDNTFISSIFVQET